MFEDYTKRGTYRFRAKTALLSGVPAAGKKAEVRKLLEQGFNIGHEDITVESIQYDFINSMTYYRFSVEDVRLNKTIEEVEDKLEELFKEHVMKGRASANVACIAKEEDEQ